MFETVEQFQEVKKLLKKLDWHIDFPAITIFQDGTGYISFSRGGMIGAIDEQIGHFSNIGEVPAMLEALIVKYKRQGSMIN